MVEKKTGSDKSNSTEFKTVSDREVVITRSFDAPSSLVFKAYTDPKIFVQWWGPKSYTTTIKKMEVKEGGAWRAVQRDESGKEYAFHGVYQEIVPSRRVVSTMEFEGVPGHVLIQSVTLEERSGKTKMTTICMFQNTEDRDGMLKTGMEWGMRESMDRLAECLGKLSKSGG